MELGCTQHNAAILENIMEATKSEIPCHPTTQIFGLYRTEIK